MNYFTFGPCEKFEDIRLIAPSKAISCLDSSLIFRVLLEIVWSKIEINYKPLSTKSSTRKENISNIKQKRFVSVRRRTQSVGHVVPAPVVPLLSPQVEVSPHVEDVVASGLLEYKSLQLTSYFWLPKIIIKRK